MRKQQQVKEIHVSQDISFFFELLLTHVFCALSFRTSIFTRRRYTYSFSIKIIEMGSGNSRPVSRFHLTGQDVINECDQNGMINHLSILVTGATSGIGIETSRVLALNGAKVFLMGRDQSKLDDVVNSINHELKSTNGSVQGVVCDLNSLASVKQFAEKFLQENSFLNVLILNAGIINYRFTQTVDGLEQVMGVNHIAHAYLTQLLMPLLINSAPSRCCRCII